MWQSVICCLLAGLMMWIPGWFGVMNVWTLLIPAALFFFGAGMLFPLATSGAMEPFPFLAGTAGALVGGLQNIGSGVLAWLSAMLPQNGQEQSGTVDDPYGIADHGVLAAAGVTDIASGTDGLTFPRPAFCRAFHIPARSSH